MGKLGVKKYTVIVWALILSLVFACLSGLAFNLFIEKERTNKKVDAAVSWSGGGTASSPYLIKDAATLIELAISVNSGVDYSNTYFKLTRSFDFQADNKKNGYKRDFSGIGVYGNDDHYSNKEYQQQQIFNGHFDGNGNTISNFCITTPTKAMLDQTQISSYEITTLGFFACLGAQATVENLRLTDFTLYVDYQSVSNSMDSLNIGGIAGAFISSDNTTAIIENCAIENMHIEKVNFPDINLGVNVGGIIAHYSI